MPRYPEQTSWIAELGLLPHNLPIAQVDINVSGENEKNLKTIGSIIYNQSQATKEGIKIDIFLMLKFMVCDK